MGFLNIYAGSGSCMTHSFHRLFSRAQGNNLIKIPYIFNVAGSWYKYRDHLPILCHAVWSVSLNNVSIRGFYCRSYCLLNMFRAPLCPSWGAQEYYTVVAACGISCCGFQVAGLVRSWGLCVRFAGCCSWGLCVRFAGSCSILQTGHITLSSTPDQQLDNHSTKYHRQQPLCNTLELLMMGDSGARNMLSKQ